MGQQIGLTFRQQESKCGNMGTSFMVKLRRVIFKPSPLAAAYLSRIRPRLLKSLYIFISLVLSFNSLSPIAYAMTNNDIRAIIRGTEWYKPEEDNNDACSVGSGDMLDTNKWCQSAKDFLIPFMKNQLAAENSLTLTVNSSGILEVNIDGNSVKIARNCNNPGNFADSKLIVNYINKVFGPGSAETAHEGCSAASGTGGNQGHIWFKDKNIGLFAYVKFLTFRMLVAPNPAEPELGQGSPFAGARTLNAMLNIYCAGATCPDGNDLSSGEKYASYGSTTPATINGTPTNGSTSMDSIRQALSCLAGLSSGSNPAGSAATTSGGWTTSYSIPEGGIVKFWFNEYLSQADKNAGKLTQYRDFNAYAKLSQNIETYKKIGKEKDFPWEVIAAIHYHEEGMYLYNPINDQGIYQFYNDSTPDGNNGGAYPLGDVSVAEFETQTRKFVDEFRTKSKKTFKYGLQNNDPSEIKDAMFSYNGRADAYKTMAENLGFNRDSQGYEGSWYVMNLADDKPYSFSWADGSQKLDASRMAMILCSRDHCVGVDGQKGNQDDWIKEDKAPGAFTFLSALIKDPMMLSISKETYQLGSPPATPSTESQQANCSGSMGTVSGTHKQLAERLIANPLLIYDHPDSVKSDLLNGGQCKEKEYPMAQVSDDLMKVLIYLLEDKKIPIRIGALISDHECKGGETYHLAGLAVDIGNEEVASQICPAIYQNKDLLKIDELIFSNCSSFGVHNLKNGLDFNYTDGVLADHKDHIHIAVKK